MTSEGLGEMFEGDSADTCARKFPLMLMGDKRTVKRVQMGSEDPHRRERKFILYNWTLQVSNKKCFLNLYKYFDDKVCLCLNIIKAYYG